MLTVSLQGVHHYYAAVLPNRPESLRVPNVLRRVFVQHNEVRECPDFDKLEPLPDKPRTWFGNQ